MCPRLGGAVPPLVMRKRNPGSPESYAAVGTFYTKWEPKPEPSGTFYSESRSPSNSQPSMPIANASLEPEPEWSKISDSASLYFTCL